VTKEEECIVDCIIKNIENKNYSLRFLGYDDALIYIKCRWWSWDRVTIGNGFNKTFRIAGIVIESLRTQKAMDLLHEHQREIDKARYDKGIHKLLKHMGC